jgi:hypothetical protein
MSTSASIDKTTMDTLVQNACLAADRVAIGFEGTDATKTRAVISEALAFLIGNKMITVNDPGTWPDWLALDPPYKGIA